MIIVSIAMHQIWPRVFTRLRKVHVQNRFLEHVFTNQNKQTQNVVNLDWMTLNVMFLFQVFIHHLNLSPNSV